MRLDARSARVEGSLRHSRAAGADIAPPGASHAGQRSLETAPGIAFSHSSDGGLRLQSGPGRDLIFKLTGEDTDGAIDYFVVEVAPHGGPPLHVHRRQLETIHVVSGAAILSATT